MNKSDDDTIGFDETAGDYTGNNATDVNRKEKAPVNVWRIDFYSAEEIFIR